MPMVLIEIGKKYTFEHEAALMQAVHTALIDAFKVTDHAINVRLLVHEPHRFTTPINTNPELYTLISIDCFTGRSLDAKRELYSCIVQNLSALGIPKDHVKIVIRESSRENWGILGGHPGCNVDVGYEVEI
ncbi:MAG TPA: tautomerase family protein [Candidatus Babeliales bacterium]|nr:tautomerase family protein [Candidatus Babeliales bacterium]